MSTEAQRTCPSCGNEFSGAMEFCPVCLLRKGLAGGVESGESSTGDTLKPTPVEADQQFDHYELVTGVSLTRRSTSICLPGDSESHQRATSWR